MIQSIRAVGIVVKDSQVLVMRRVTFGQEYFTLPGGGVEENEQVETAVIRELAEETTIKVEILKLLYVHRYLKSEQYFYLCGYISGTPHLAQNSEEKKESSPDNLFEPLWLSIHQLENTLLYPLEIRDWLLEDLALNFIGQYPRVGVLDETKLRQVIAS